MVLVKITGELSRKDQSPCVPQQEDTGSHVVPHACVKFVLEPIIFETELTYA